MNRRIDWPVALLGVAFLLVTISYGVHILVAGSDRNATQQKVAEQISSLQATVGTLQTTVTALRSQLTSDDATIAALHADAVALARKHHITAADVRRLERESRPRTVMVPVPGPTTTVTVTASPPARHHHHHHRPTATPSPRCTYLTYKGRCLPTISPVPVPSMLR